MSAEITQWIDPDGVVTPLDVDWEATGRFMPDVAHEEDAVPGQAGGRHRASRHKVKEFTIKLTLVAADEGSLRTLQRNTVRLMDPTRGAGTIRVTSPIGDVREILCFYSAGLGMEEKPGSSGPNMQQAGVLFRAYEPYWRATSDISQTFTIGAIPSFFPFFPLRLTSSQIVVDAVVTNTGDVEAWPVWTITGPGSTIVLRNLTTGESITFTGLTLGAGESVIIDTRPGYKTVTTGAGVNVFSTVDVTTSTLWALPVGSSTVRLEMSGATAGVSAVTVAHRPRYLSP